MSLRSSGTSCVCGYTRNRAKLNQWLGQECFEHRPLSRRDCSCPKRYDFHRLPTEDGAKRMWLKNSNMKQPPKELYVCSFHSVEKTPTQEKPCPALWRGYERPPEKRRRILKRIDDVAPASDVQQLLKQQERRSSLDQEEPEPSHIKKEEEEEVLISQEGEQLHDLEEADVTKFPLTIITVKSEKDEEKAQSSQLQKQSEERRETESVISRSTQFKRESDGEDCGGPEPARNTYPVIQQVWSLSVIQEEEGEQLHHLEADITKFPFTIITVKSEDDEDKVQSSQLHRSFIKTEENREAEPLASSSTQQTETGAHVEDCGGPGPSRNLDPGSDLQPACDGPQPGENRFSCSVCGKIFKRNRNLKTHMKIHTGEDPVSCSVCGKIFKRNRNLKTHMRIHTGEKLFSCSLCSKKFNQSGKLKTHMRIHTGEKPFSCSLCSKKFNESGELKRHMRIHTGEKTFSCSSCGKKFFQFGQLKTHMRIHTGEKPFSCSFCSQSFTQNGNLKSHMRVHTGEKPFSCSECGKTFRHSNGLKSHMSVHSKEKELSEDGSTPLFYIRYHLWGPFTLLNQSPRSSC